MTRDEPTLTPRSKSARVRWLTRGEPAAVLEWKRSRYVAADTLPALRLRDGREAQTWPVPQTALPPPVPLTAVAAASTRTRNHE
jgi:hypothetical protein